MQVFAGIWQISQALRTKIGVGGHTDGSPTVDEPAAGTKIDRYGVPVRSGAMRCIVDMISEASWRGRERQRVAAHGCSEGHQNDSCEVGEEEAVQSTRRRVVI